MSENERIYFLGRFPTKNEVGGVISFTYNFAERFKSRELVVVDPYPAKEKKIVPTGVISKFITGRYLVVRLIKLWWLVFSGRGRFIFNFSSVRSCIFLAVIPKTTRSEWVGIFHNGDQAGLYGELSRLQRSLIKIGLNKIDLIGCISPKQKKFFMNVGVSSKLARVSPYLPSKGLDGVFNKMPTYFYNDLSFLISGFPTKIYQILEGLDLFEELYNEGYSFKLSLCLYGSDSDGLLSKIIERCEKMVWVDVYMHMSVGEFGSLLKETDIYLRLNSVDSFGLVVAEAIELGVVVIATDVCERYPGANLISADFHDDLKYEVKHLFKEKKLSGRLKVQSAVSDIMSHEAFLASL